MTNPIELSLKKQCQLIQEGHITSESLTNLYLERIKLKDPDYNIVIKEYFDTAGKRAKELDQIFKTTGKTVGPLHGIAFTIKDAFRIKKTATSFGFPGFNLLPSFSNCSIVERLIQAGGICIGQTNVPFSCFDWQTNSPMYGLTKNPANTEHTVGGSSGGSAASVAAYFSPFEVGSDVAGSIRYPAHCCGVFGLRPTHNFVPFNDIGPSMNKESFDNLAVAGPLGRSIEDIELVLSIIANSQNNSKTKTKLKVTYSFGWTNLKIDKKTETLINSFLEKLKNDGHIVTAFTPQMDFPECERVYGIILGYEYKQMIPPPFKAKPFMKIFNHIFNTKRLREGIFKENFEKGLLANKQDYKEALKAAKNLATEFHLQLSDCDLWITPVSPSAAIKHEKTGALLELNGKLIPYAEFLGQFLTSTTLFHHPVLTAPIGTTSDNLPIGIQIHGKPNQDWQLLSDAACFNEHYFFPKIKTE